MKKCEVKIGIRKNGVRYKAGSIIELTDVEIARLSPNVIVISPVQEVKEARPTKGSEAPKLPELEKTIEKSKTQTNEGDK